MNACTSTLIVIRIYDRLYDTAMLETVSRIDGDRFFENIDSKKSIPPFWRSLGNGEILNTVREMFREGRYLENDITCIFTPFPGTTKMCH